MTTCPQIEPIEHDPTGAGFDHYGTEWDWLEFFWNIYTQGGTGVRWDVSQINDVWTETSDVAYFCCLMDAEEETPTACLPRDMSAACGTPTNLYPTQTEVGKLWADDTDFDVTHSLLETAATRYNDPIGHPSTYNPDKYNLFYNTGGYARVNY